MKFTLDEGQARFWTTVFGGLTALGLIVGGFYTLFQYQHNRQLEAENREKDLKNYALQLENAKRETQKTFFARQLELCEMAASNVATIADGGDPSAVKRATNDFWRLYWGPLGMVEDTKVAGLMYRFGECVKKRQHTRSGAGCGEPLEWVALDLAHACRELVSKSWDLNLPSLPDAPKQVSSSANQTPPQ